MISKYAPKRKNMLIDEKSIIEELKLIDGSENYYITKSAKVYRKYSEGFYLLKPFLATCGYYYVTLQINKKKKKYRLHRLVAQAFIPNPNNYKIVGHIDNIKTNCNVSNLYWTTSSENTQKAINDKLLVNAKGYEDSQSKPVVCYDISDNEIGRYGSVRECHRALGISCSTILRHCYHKTLKSRCGYHFEFQNI
jgi:hypothetical protein